MIVGAEHGDRRARLRQPVGVGEADAGHAGQRLLEDGAGHPGAAVGDRPERGHVRRAAAEVIDQPRQHRRHQHRLADPLIADGGEPLGGGEVRQVHHPAAGEGVREHRAHARDVVRRDADERRVILISGRELHRLEHVGDQVRVTEHRALRLRRGPAGVQHDRRELIVDVRGGRGLGRPRRGQPLARGEDRGGHALDGAGVLLVDDQDRPLAEPGGELGQLPGRQPVVQRRERHPGQPGGEEADRERGAAGADEARRRRRRRP